VLRRPSGSISGRPVRRSATNVQFGSPATVRRSAINQQTPSARRPAAWTCWTRQQLRRNSQVLSRNLPCLRVTLRRSSRISAGHVTGSIPGSSTGKMLVRAASSGQFPFSSTQPGRAPDRQSGEHGRAQPRHRRPVWSLLCELQIPVRRVSRSPPNWRGLGPPRCSTGEVSRLEWKSLALVWSKSRCPAVRRSAMGDTEWG
jgi:hypothetical protein